MVAVAVVFGVLAVGFLLGLVAAEVVDRRRSIEQVADPTRWAPPALNPRLPW